jgi:hypothetical protein
MLMLMPMLMLLGLAVPAVRAAALPVVAPGAAAPAAKPAPPVLDAAGLAQRFPSGSLTTGALADTALTAAQGVQERADATFELQREHCMHVFFVNHCLDGARKLQRVSEREVRRVTLEAHEVRRQIEAREHIASRTAELQRQAAEDALRPQREREAMLAAKAREDSAAERELDAQRDARTAAQSGADMLQRQREQQEQVARKDALRPQQESDAQQAFRDKQQQAADYAQTRARDRIANTKRRDQRSAERAAQAKADAAASAAAAAAGHD